MSDEDGKEAQVRRIVELALAEDLGEEGDVTSQAIFYAGDLGAARVVTRQECIISGMAAAAEVCRQVDADLAWLPLVRDGQRVPASAELARLEGKLVSILAAERTLLNFLSGLSGIATLTAGYVAALEGLKTRVAATRKTSPGMRLLQKRAVADGGGELHRLGLFDAVLIKDNHIAAAGGVSQAIEAMREARGEDVVIEVEVDTVEQLREAVEANVDRVLLDNMEPGLVAECVSLVDGRLMVEASGGIGLENVRAYGEAGADIVSAGSLTSSAAAVDLSLEVER